MKKLVILLLVISALFTFGCENRSFSNMSDEEIIESISERDLLGTWIPLGDHSGVLVLSETYASLGDLNGDWNYGEKGVRVQIGDTAFYFEVSVNDKKIRLELDGKLFVRDEQIKEIALSKDNIWHYFKLEYTDSWQENDGAMWFEREYALTLQDKYKTCYADGADIRVEIKSNYYDYEIDYQNKTFNMTQKDESYAEQTENLHGTTERGRLVLHTAFLKEGESYSFPELSEVRVISADGKIYIVE